MPLASNDTSIELLQRTARRWASSRFAPVRAELERQWCPNMPEVVIRELAEQGYLPAPTDGLDDWTPPTIARLGEAMGAEAPAAFVVIVTHVLALYLSAGLTLNQSHAGGNEPLLATSPYWDFSKVASPVRVEHLGGEWIVNGHFPLVVNGNRAEFILVPALTPEKNRVICGISRTQLGVTIGESVALFGLRGASAQNIEFASVSVAEACVSSGHEATRDTMERASRVLGWSVVGLLTGITFKSWKQASEYAGLRIQGGRSIIEHPPVAKLVESIQFAKEQLTLWLGQLDASSEALLPPLKQARKCATSGTDAALQVFGGIGYICPSAAEQCWRDARQAATLCSTCVHEEFKPQRR